MFIALTPKRALEKDEKGKFLVPISIDVGEVHSFYIPMYDTYEEALKDSPNNTILELPITAEMDMLEIEVVTATKEVSTTDTPPKKLLKTLILKRVTQK